MSVLVRTYILSFVLHRLSVIMIAFKFIKLTPDYNALTIVKAKHLENLL